jgi:hypothetical protein
VRDSIKLELSFNRYQIIWLFRATIFILSCIVFLLEINRERNKAPEANNSKWTTNPSKKPKTTLNITSSITITASTTSGDELLDPKFAED